MLFKKGTSSCGGGGMMKVLLRAGHGGGSSGRVRELVLCRVRAILKWFEEWRQKTTMWYFFFLYILARARRRRKGQTSIRYSRSNCI